MQNAAAKLKTPRLFSRRATMTIDDEAFDPVLEAQRTHTHDEVKRHLLWSYQVSVERVAQDGDPGDPVYTHVPVAHRTTVRFIRRYMIELPTVIANMLT